MSEMRERVKAAIERELHALTEPGTRTIGGMAGRCVDAAIEAMRDPTQEMIEAADLEIRKHLGIFCEDLPAAVWRAMIDAEGE